MSSPFQKKFSAKSPIGPSPLTKKSPLNSFPVKPNTKLNENESIIVYGGGRNFKFDNAEEASAKRQEFRNQGDRDAEMFGVTEIKEGPDAGTYTEQRIDAKSGQLRTEKQEQNIARSKKDPKPNVKSNFSSKNNRGYTDKFTLESTNEKNSSVGQAYDRVYKNNN